MLPESHYRPSKYKVDKRSVYENLKTGLLCSKVCSVQQHVHDIINYVQMSTLSIQEIQSDVLW